MELRPSKNLHLGISAFVVIAAGLIYGFNPGNIMYHILGFEVQGPELQNVFKAIMGLYLTMGAFWILGIIKPAYWRTATLTNVLFIGGVALGRCVGLIVDGVSAPWVVATLLEFFMAIWGVHNLIRDPGKGGLYV